MIFDYKDIKKNIDETCDVCVIGSGAGGAVVAKELAEVGLSVILLEEGGYYRTEDFQNTDLIDSVSKLWRNAGSTFLFGKPNVVFIEGRCVGGSTTINGGMCWRTPEKILKRWEWEKGLNDLSPEKMEPFFDRVEKNIFVNSVHPVSQNKDADLLRRGSQKLGYRVKENLRNHHYCVGANQCITGCPTGGKQPMIMNYIPSFIKAGGHLYTNCRVKKIRFKSGRAVGVVGSIVNPQTKQVVHKLKIKSKVTIVCCGAIQTPALLKRSGLPDKSKQLGENLLIHPNTKVIGIFDEPVNAWKGVNQACQVTEFMDEGILMGVNFVPPAILSLAFSNYGSDFLERMKDIYNHAVAGAALIEDTSRGRVHAFPFDQTYATYYLNKRDFEMSLRATALLAEIYFAAGAKRVYLPFRGLPEINTVDHIRKIFSSNIKPEDVELMTVHIMGSCHMGANPYDSVLNSFGEAHQVKGLYVADASVFPTSIGVNPQETIMALATRTAFHIAENASSYLSA